MKVAPIVLLFLVMPSISLATIITCGSEAICNGSYCTMIGGSPRYFINASPAPRGHYDLVRVSLASRCQVARCWYNRVDFYFESKTDYPMIPVYGVIDDEWVGAYRHKLCDPQIYPCELEIGG